MYETSYINMVYKEITYTEVTPFTTTLCNFISDKINNIAVLMQLKRYIDDTLTKLDIMDSSLGMLQPINNQLNIDLSKFPKYLSSMCIAGGFLRNLCDEYYYNDSLINLNYKKESNYIESDIDIYFPEFNDSCYIDSSSTVLPKVYHSTINANSSVTEILQSSAVHFLINNFNAVVIKDNYASTTLEIPFHNLKLDLVKICYDHPVKVIANMDFTVCMIAYDFKYLYTHSRTTRDIIDKRISIVGGELPFNTLMRILKYNKKGYYIDTSLDDTNINTIIPEAIKTKRFKKLIKTKQF